ncbi:MAG: HD domain-containing protein [Treponema sp.]|nr:HD domain-containing protein [Treponema sp.]
MKKLFRYSNYLTSVKNAIVSVPAELKEQFDQELLKNSLFRIKILSVLQTIIKIIYVFVYTYTDTLDQLPKTSFYEVYPLTIITILFLFLTGVFSKFNNRCMLWFMCYLFIVYYFAYAALNIFFIGTDYITIFLFSVTLFLGMFMPDFKPKIFILSAVLFYVLTAAILVYHDKGFRFEGPQEFVFFTFVAIIILKTLYYNSKVNIFMANKEIEKQKNELRNYSDNLEDMVREKTKNIVELKNAVMETIAELVERRDDATGGHINRTSRYMKIFIDTILDKELYKDQTASWDNEQMILSAQLHDVGKIAVDDSILRKPGKLSEEEFEKMKKHTVFGGEIIKEVQRKTGEKEYLNYANIFAVYHHEKWDGSGYPYGIAGENIPLPARIMAIIDVYDALISERPYKKPFTHEKALEIIKGGKGSHFDSCLVDVFLSVSEQLLEIIPQKTPCGAV